MSKNKILFHTCILFVVLFIVNACGNNVQPPSIGNNISYPGSLVALNSSNFLMLNTTSNGDYIDGSIQQYSIDRNGNSTFQSAISVPAHGSEIAVSPDSKIVALSFDASANPTQIQFYNYTSPTSPALLNNLTLNFYGAGGKQSIKRLGFFTPTNGGSYYYLYGVIYNFAQDDGSYANIPPRVFVAKIAQNFSSATAMFSLSMGIGDPNSLSIKSNSAQPYTYSFGSNAPTFDSTHNLLIAFPTGSVGGFNTASYTYPPNPPSIFNYLSGQANGNAVTCSSPTAICSQPDLRVVSLFAVDFTALLNGDPLNNSVYFVPLAWNNNGISYGATTNGVALNYGSYNATGGSANVDLNSLSFQANFWAANWNNTPNLGNSGSTQCYTSSTATSSTNQYNLNSVGGNGLLVSKIGTNGSLDSGFGNEVFQITGLDILSNSINTIKGLRGGVQVSGENDFNAIALNQIFDPFNKYYSSLQSSWLNSSSPLIPYMYSRTTGVGTFSAMASAPINFSVLNFGANSCLPYWVRDTYLGVTNWALDSAWLSANPVSLTTGSNSTFYNATIDPTQPANYSFPYASGAQLCTNVSPSNTPFVFCANFLNGAFTRFRTSSSGTIFNPF